jgi:hypothetical protein
MNKDKIYSPSIDEFVSIVTSSKSINEVARKLGFKHIPGQRSKDRIKKRIADMNISLAEREEVKVYEKQESVFGNTRSVGNVGESVFILESSRMDLAISKPVFDDLPYDFILDTKFGLKKIQVKTAQFMDSTKSKVRFKSVKGVSYRKGVRETGKYNSEDLDYFFLHCIENGESYLVKNEGKTETIIRTSKPRNGQNKGVNFAEDVLFSKVVKDLI